MLTGYFRYKVGLRAGEKLINLANVKPSALFVAVTLKNTRSD